MSHETDDSRTEDTSAETPAPAAGGMFGLLRGVLIVVIVCGLATGAAFGLKHLEKRAVDGKAGPEPKVVGVTVLPVPDWMPQSLGTMIARELLPGSARYNDPNLTLTVHAMACRHPWIRQVGQVRKEVTADPRIGRVIVQVEFRQPAARVKLDDGKYIYVDRDGYRLPAAQVPQFMRILSDEGIRSSQECFITRKEAPRDARPIHYIDIIGIASPPPPDGALWTDAASKGKAPPAMADDLAVALKMVALVNSRPYSNQVRTVDVRNLGERISKSEPQIRLTAQIDDGPVTDIRFGRLPDPAGDYEVPTERKLKNLDVYVADHEGCLAGKNRYIELRYDTLHVSIN